jgi:hypothetical protein
MLSLEGLTFLHPELLWGLGLAAVPIIIHLINRIRAKRKAFAAIDFLLRVQRRSARRILLRRLLLLLVRTLLVITLVLTAAGLVRLPSGAATTSGSTSLALIIDTSFSMLRQNGKRRLFDLAIEQAATVVRRMTPGDCACLLRAGLEYASPESRKTPADMEVLVQPCQDTSKPLLSALERIRPGFGSSNLSQAIERAAQLLKTAPGPNRKIILFTDGAAHAFLDAPRLPPEQPLPEVELVDVAESLSRSNHAVTGIELHPQGSALEIHVQLANNSSAPAKDLPLEIRLGEQTSARGFVDLPANGRSSKVFTISMPRTRTIGSARLAPDDLAQDDERPFFLTGASLVRVVLVDGDMRGTIQQDELYYAEQALSPVGQQTSGISFITITPERFQESLLAEADVVVLANVRELTPERMLALHRFVTSGGGLLITLGDQVDIELTNTFLADLLPWTLRDIVALGPADPDGIHRQGLGFAAVSNDHPVFSLFPGEQSQALAAVRTQKAAVLEPGRAAHTTHVLLRYQNGSPALVEGAVGAGRVLLFTSTLDRDWNNWPTRASFLPFVQRVVFYLSRRLDDMPPPEITVGSPMNITLLPDADSIIVHKPNGEASDFPAHDFSGRQVVFRDTYEPGWYGIEQHNQGNTLRGATLPGFLVHPPSAESDLAAITAERLQALLGQELHLTVAQAGTDILQSLSYLFLLLGLLLILAEGFLVKR